MHAVRRVALSAAGAILAGLLLGLVTQGADHVHPALKWVGGLGVPWLLVAFCVGALARRRVAGAAGGAVALVVATMTWYVLHAAATGRGIAHIVVVWSALAVVCGGVFGAAGAHWRAGHAAPVALLAGAFAGEALVLATEWPRHVAGTVLVAELAVAALLPFLLTRPLRAIPLVLALTAVATIVMGAATDEIRDAARAAGWRGL